MIKKTNNYLFIFCFSMILFFSACQQPGGNSTGSEFMPDMGHSVAYEANYYTYYYNNTWGTEDEYYKMAKPRKPVEGTRARGYIGISMSQDDESKESMMKVLNGEGSGISVPINGNVPYYYEDTEEDRTRAIEEIIENPYHITDAGLALGKELYNIYCGICHGDKGDGNGYIVREPNPVTGDAGGKYPVQPANLLLPEFVSSSNGRYYHSIMYGKNLMGGYPDKLSYEERWHVIHYIRSLQAKDQKLAYNQLENTLNTVDIPAGEQIVEVEISEAEQHDEAQGDSHEDSQDDGQGEGH